MSGDTLTRWLARDLECALVKLRYDYRPSGITEQVAVRIIPGEPGAELFCVPGRYREVPPSQLYRISGSFAARRDRDYFLRQAEPQRLMICEKRRGRS
jgi:hypothetical protein